MFSLLVPHLGALNWQKPPAAAEIGLDRLTLLSTSGRIIEAA